MTIDTIEDAQHEVDVITQEATADNPDVTPDPADAVVTVVWNIEDDDLARELCRRQLGCVPRDLEAWLGCKDWLLDTIEGEIASQWDGVS